uniref:Uncharacterized protein n=1 Tax=Anopheles arabiensis TaxID=7173 RepID=A0A182IHL7_ANOAR
MTRKLRLEIHTHTLNIKTNNDVRR